MRLRLLAWFAAILACPCGGLAAQAVRGDVVLPDSATPVLGAIVVARRRDGTEAARTLTGTRGLFTLRLPAAGDYTLQVLRIGYRPGAGPRVAVADRDTETLHIVFAAEPVVLAGVNVRERETCRVNADTGFAASRVWGEARKAMLSSQLTSGDAPLVAEWIEYDRVLDSAARVVKQQRVRVLTHPTTHAFKSRPADQLSKDGYVVAEAGGTTYYAPDVDVLLSESFAATHCFRLVEAPSDQAQLIGIGIDPSRDHRDARDITGTLWLDRRTAELRTLDFRFTNLPELAVAAGAGGQVEFLRLDDGNWLVSRWYLRMPLVAPRDAYAEGGTRRVVMAASNLVLRGVQTTGGEVNQVMRHDSVVYSATGPHLAVRVLSPDSTLTVAGARLTLEGTDYIAYADSVGHIELDPVLPGRYRARVSTPLMDSLGLAPVAREVESRQGSGADTLVLPIARDVLRAVCPTDSVRNGEGMVRGRVRDERANAIAGAAVTATWQGNFNFVDARDGQRLAHAERTVGVLTDAGGQWRLCGIPRERTIILRVRTDSGSDTRRTQLDASQQFTALDLVIHHEVAALNGEARTALGETAPPTALVEIAVSELGGAPLADAAIEVEARGQTRTVLTGPTGRALIPDLPPGRLVLRARHIGYAPGQFAISVQPGRNTVPIILSRNAPPALDTVRVIGNQRIVGLRRNDEFETRRINHLATVSITRDDIVKRNPASLWQMLLNIPSIKVVDSGYAVVVMSTRVVVSSVQHQGPCYLAIAVDGQVVNDDPVHQAYDLRQLPAPDEVHGVEVFAGASTIRVQYGGVGNGKWCGMVAIWTR